MSSLMQQLNAEMAAVVERVQPTLVRVHNSQGGAGAGIIVHPQGLIITNAHVIGHRAPEVALQDGRILPARLLAHDPERDLAALIVDATGLSAIPLGDSRHLRPGDWVLALGHPWGVAGAATAGAVIGVGSEWSEIPLSGRELIMASLRLRPGHSGGPLVNMHGQLVGINTLITGPDVGVAVPVHVVKTFLKSPQLLRAL